MSEEFLSTIIAGSRDIHDYQLLLDTVYGCGWEIGSVICGMAKGVDLMGKKWAESEGIPVVECHAKWKDISAEGAVIRHGKFGAYNALAGHWRNQEMADKADALILLHNGSDGSMDMLRRAKEKGLRIHEVRLSKDGSLQQELPL